MDWLKAALGNPDGADHADELRQAFLEGEKMARDFAAQIIEASKTKYYNHGKYMEATLFLFVAVLRATGLIKKGVYASQHKAKKLGAGSNPVGETWAILEEALTSEDVNAAIGNILKRKAEDGKA